MRRRKRWVDRAAFSSRRRCREWEECPRVRRIRECGDLRRSARHPLWAHVTGVCSTSNVELVKSLGADEVVDYTKQDFTEAGQIYDIIFDAVGKGSPSRGKRVLAETGSYVSVRSSTKEKTEDLLVLRDLIEAGEVKAVIDRRYSLEQIPESPLCRERPQAGERGDHRCKLISGHRSTCRVRVHTRSRRRAPAWFGGGMTCG